MDEKEYTDEKLNAILAGLDFRLSFENGYPAITNVTTHSGSNLNDNEFVNLALREWLNRWVEQYDG